jgi:hypothetical protein
MMFETLQAMLKGDGWNDIPYPAQKAIRVPSWYPN